MVACSRCGHENDAEDRYCASCGVPLREDTAGIAPVDVEDAPVSFPFPEEQLAPGQALLLLRSGPAAGSTFLMERSVVTVGRDPGSDLFLDDVTVSRKHAEFRRQDDGFYVHDLGSLNGTYVNRDRIDLTKLASQDEIQVGRYKLVFFAAEG